MSIRIRNKLVFLRHPRTGSTATAEALIKLGGRKAGNGQHNFVKAGRGELTVSTVRNPFDVLASWFELNPEWPDMEKFLLNYKHTYFTQKNRLFYFAADSDVILLYDDLNVQLNWLLKRLHLGQVRIYRIGGTPNKKPFMDYFNKKTIAIVREKFWADVALYQSLLRLEQ